MHCLQLFDNIVRAREAKEVRLCYDISDFGLEAFSAASGPMSKINCIRLIGGYECLQLCVCVCVCVCRRDLAIGLGDMSQHQVSRV